MLYCSHYKVNGSWTDTGDNDGKPYVTELQSSMDSPPPADDSVLVLTNLTIEQSGPYSCMVIQNNEENENRFFKKVKNQYGGDLSTGWITVSQADAEVAALR